MDTGFLVWGNLGYHRTPYAKAVGVSCGPIPLALATGTARLVYMTPCHQRQHQIDHGQGLAQAPLLEFPYRKKVYPHLGCALPALDYWLKSEPATQFIL